jgi:hypothetical protein
MLLLCATSASSDVYNDIIAAGVGGAMAGFIIWLGTMVVKCILNCRDKKRVYNYLNKAVNENRHWYTSRNIASHTDLTQDRVRYIGSIDDRFVLSIGKKPDRWGIKGRSDEKRNSSDKSESKKETE